MSDLHVSEPTTFEEGDDGFYVPACACGWSFGAVPDIETATDVLMEHAYEMAAARFERGNEQ